MKQDELDKLRALHEYLTVRLMDAEQDMADDASEAETSGERPDLWVYEVCLDLDKAKAITSALPALIAQAERVNALEAALKQIAKRAHKLRHGTDDWFELVEFEAVANAALEQTGADHG